MVVMILSLAIGNGFKKEIREKIIGFGSHIQVVNYDFNFSYESNPIIHDAQLVESIKDISGVLNVQRFATKPGLIKTDDEMQGVVLKGIGSDYNASFLESILTRGQLPDILSDQPSTHILISETLSQMLGIEVGDDIFMYFFQDQIRARRYTISGIYNSHLPDLDKLYVIADIRQIQGLNNWSDAQIAGYEIIIDDFDQTDQKGIAVYDVTADYISPDGHLLRTQTIRQTQPQIFGWLDLLDMNIAVIILLIVLVAGFNMISGLLILILERTNMIGILKALGMADWPLRRIFLYLATRIAARGLIWGNIIGISIAVVQKQFGVFELDPANYFLSTVPIMLTPLHLLLLNLGAVLVIFLMMIGPSYLAARISPVKAIQFE
ncbi:ABC transporter, permease protein [Geofilum rubicundum JCM 15548]|uniref:ABC transporter, permease protein n=2 Tax=Geofilum TaxID=1236988 RepID=A0A0E9M0E0_9BACT|nr:ABC transporter, permease protein [Geofilum rubicundum JCM 15548]